MKKNATESYRVIGLMSGTSLDGLDIVAVTLTTDGHHWQYKVDAASTISYPQTWKRRLIRSGMMDGASLIHLHHQYGLWMGNKVNDFIGKTHFHPDLISSHGHTVFHQPEKRFTFQLGNGYDLAACTGVHTVWDFRSLDVALGGQGAPLVPVGDKLLFSEYDYCINLGGFANISYDDQHRRVAFDICPCNLAMQYIVAPEALEYDKDGEIGRSGNVDARLFEALNQIPYYQSSPPKSLGKEWMEATFIPVLERFSLSMKDQLRTVYEHIAYQVSRSFGNDEKGKVLITGGGAYNRFLVSRIKALSRIPIEIPDPVLVNYKEAIIFAFLGVLKYRNEINCYASVTGASNDSVTGNLVLINK